MTNSETTLSNVSHYCGFSNHQQLFGAEKILLDAIVTSGMRVLDIGCGTGRVSLAMHQRGAVVDACDLNSSAIEALRHDDPSHQIQAVVADARSLPYADNQFDLVIFPFNGLDFLHPESERRQVIREMSRVLKDHGACIFSSHNPIGAILTPRGAFSFHSWKCKILQVANRETFQKYHSNHQGLHLYHATPHNIIQLIESESPLRITRTLDKDGRFSSKMLLTLFSPWPYYHFTKH